MKRNFIILLLCSCALTLDSFAQKNVEESTLRQWIASNATKLDLSNAELQNIRISDFYYDKNANAVIAYLQQTYKGVDVYNAITTVAFREGKAISVSSSKAPLIEKKVSNQIAKPAIRPEEAVRTAAASVQLPIVQPVSIPLMKDAVKNSYVFDKLGIASNNITANLMWVPDEHTGMYYLSWEVSIHALKKNDLWMVKIDAQNGSVLTKDNFTVSCAVEAKHSLDNNCITQKHYTVSPDAAAGAGMVSSAKYNVIPYPFSDPDWTKPVLVTNPWEMFPNTDATTLKWHNDNSTHSFDSTRGNNVLVQEDRDGNNGYGYGALSKTAYPNLDFNYKFTDTSAVEFGDNQKFSMTNLFYWNNIIHDLTYQYGFDEVSGNFQSNNLGRGGSGNDYVLADAQDGSGMNNANFATPSDGLNPRMQMFLFTFKSPSMTINYPEDIDGVVPMVESAFSANNKLGMTGTVTGDMVFYLDSAKDESHSACVKAFNASELKGKIAFIVRGGCDFVIKVKNAQNAGAIAAIVMNNTGGSPISMGGSDNSITIPAVMISQDDGLAVAELMEEGRFNVTLHPGIFRDGSLDNGIVVHEYFHGISNRLTGGPKNVSCLQNKEQMGEGWSDYGALMMTTDWSTARPTDGALPRGMGNYAIGASPNGGGIRWYPYSTDMKINPWVYKDLKGGKIDSEAHNIGEVWCAILWDMTWDIINSDGINRTFWDASKPGGNSVAMNLVMQGMKLQKCSPGFVSGRDGILKADTLLYGGKYSPLVWMAFARRGVGYSASEGSEKYLGDLVDAYDLPPALPAIWDVFTAEKVNVSGLLKWTTLCEQNVEYYIVERSTDGNNYSEIGRVKAVGNSTVKQSYGFTDVKPLGGNNIYRIQVLDQDGRISYSAARTLNFGIIKNSITISPNPAHNLAIITLKNNMKPMKVSLFNSFGQQVGSYNMTNESLTIDVSKLTAGTYFINVKGEGVDHREKLIVQ